MDVLKYIIGGVIVLIILAFYVSVPIRIKRHLMKQMLVRQQKQIPVTTLLAKHITDIEDSLTSLILFPCLTLFIGLFVFNYVRGNNHLREDPWNSLLGIFLFVTILFYLLDIIIFYLRRATGAIQGAVLFDPKEKKIYAFPSLASDYYNMYHESELVYTTESFSVGRMAEKTVYVFFTQPETEFAFKVRDLDYNNFDAILSQQEPFDISVPFKHRFHTQIIGLIVFIFDILCVLFLVWFALAQP